MNTNPVVILNLCASPIDSWLLNNQAEKLIEGVQKLAEGKEIVVCLPEESSALDSLGCTKFIIVRSPVLHEPTALYTAMDTGVIRVHPIVKTIPEEGWQHRPTQVVGGEDAWRAATGAASKFVEINGEVKEVALGTALSELVEASKPVLVGGCNGQFVAIPELANMTVTENYLFDSIQTFGDKDCLAVAAAEAMHQCAGYSCHNCVLCREGSWHLENIFQGITAGKGKKEDLAMVEDIAPIMQVGCFCDFGRGMATAALSAVQTCRSELEAHIVKKTCPAGVCKAFANYAIRPDLCTGCGDCIDECPEDAIEGKKGFIHMIDADMCEKCGKCAEVCEENAIVVGEKFRVPKKLTRVGRFS